MVHLRIVAPHPYAAQALEVLGACESVLNVVAFPGAATKPEGDLIMCEVAREDASVLVSDLRELGVHHHGSIAIEDVDTMVSDRAQQAEDSASGSPADAVIWEQVSARTSEEASLSATYLAFLVLAMFIAAIGIFEDSPILIVGAMVVGPEFGPVAGFCVAVVQRRPQLAVRSLLALVVGFPVGIAMTVLLTLALRAAGVIPQDFSSSHHSLANAISSPNFLSFFVAFSAGIAGMLSLTTAKSGALIGVLISVTTIPAAANIAVAFTYADWSSWRGAQEQLAVNLSGILAAGIATLFVQRRLYLRRRRRHRAALAASRARAPSRA